VPVLNPHLIDRRFLSDASSPNTSSPAVIMPAAPSRWVDPTIERWDARV
jgi:hypothetical protein